MTPSAARGTLSAPPATAGRSQWACWASSAAYRPWASRCLFQNELDEIVRVARANGAAADPALRQRIADAHIGLRIMRCNAMRMLSGGGDDGTLRREALIYKLHWATWHRNLGKLAMDVLGPEGEICAAAPYELSRLQSMFLFTRSDTIYGGTNQIQRNIIAERALGMPREPRG